MSLREYQKKRRFEKTPEPAGEVKKSEKTRFVIQEHHASHLHYDFRLEMGGVLKSFAVPKNLAPTIGEKRLGVQTEDHPVDYIEFEGVIPEGNYGAGTVKIWDSGEYRLLEKTSRSYKIELKGKKIKGPYQLFNFKEKNWFIFKIKL